MRTNPPPCHLHPFKVPIKFLRLNLNGVSFGQIGVTLRLAKLELVVSHPSVVAPVPVKYVAAVAFPLKTHLTQFAAATPSFPPLGVQYVPPCPVGILPFHLGVVAGTCA